MACRGERINGTSGWARATGLDFRKVALLPLSCGRLDERWQRRLDSNQGPQLQRLVSEATRLHRIWLPAACEPTVKLYGRVIAGSDGGSPRRKPPLRMQQCLKQPRSAARAWVVAAELLGQLLATHDAITALDPRLRREALASLARDLESTRRLRRWVSWRTPCAVDGTGRPGWARSTDLCPMRTLLCR